VCSKFSVTMPVMETDMEDPEYVAKKWESAVAKIIATIDNATTALNATTAATTNIVAPIAGSPNSSSTSSGQVVPVAKTIVQPAVNYYGV